MKTRKVYGWISSRSGEGQTREIVAAFSLAGAARLAGVRSPRDLWNITETGSAVEIAVAMNFKTLGCVCWKQLDEHDPILWTRDVLRKVKP